MGAVQRADRFRQPKFLREGGGLRHAPYHQMKVSALEIFEQGVGIAFHIDQLGTEAGGQLLDDGAILVGVLCEPENADP
jgi:hypothetical protein